MIDNPFDPNNPSRRLSDYEWDVLWKKMTSRRIVEMDKKRSNPWDSALQDENQYKEMVVALLSGKNAWNHWYEQYPHIDFYNFDYLDFFHEINLIGATYINGRGFFGVTFNKSVQFIETKFNKRVNFLQAKFLKGASFPKAIFNEEAYFKEAEFSQLINFAWAEFKKQVNFVDATFAEKVDFVDTTFASNAHFYKTKFLKEANFLQATFTKYAVFNEAEFAEEVNFNQAILNSSGFFDKARFEGDSIDFSEMILSPDSNLLFKEASFFHAVPDFRYLNHTPDMRFHNLSVPSPCKLKSEGKWDSYNEDRYRKLKELAIGNDNHEYELQFYGYEMDSKLINIYGTKEKRLFIKKWCRSFNKKLWKFCNKKIWRLCNEKIWKFYKAIKKIFSNKKKQMNALPTFLYKFFSNYGQSIWLPLIWLFVIWGVSSICYLKTDYGSGFDLSWSNFSLLWRDILFQTIKPIMPAPFFIFDINSLGYLGTKTIASVFWFFLFLGLRNRFKIK